MGTIHYTAEQRACIERLAGPLDISAGAGSGKTFTLTQRIAYALSKPDSGIDDIDQICAITFTSKAAEELKGRVRSALRARGLFDQALKVDSAWISTIHGMCSRILRASALDLGIDPHFGVIGEHDRGTLLNEAINEVLGQRSDIASLHAYDDLFTEFPLRSHFRESSVTSMIGDIINAASSMPEGFNGFFRASNERPRASALAKELLLAYEDVVPVYEGYKATDQRDAALAKAQGAMQKLEDFIVSGSQDIDGLVKVMDACPVLAKINAAAVKKELEAYQRIHGRIAQKVVLAKGSLLLDQVLDLARRVDEVFSQKKRAAAVLDNDDLVKLTLKALDIPAIAAQYENRFKLVMVDEFQDTDALQIAIIRHLAGSGMRYLCTVGDAQQSIYRFRGADVNGYNAFRDGLMAPEIVTAGGQAAHLMLRRNFRSHADVLSFVKKVCAQSRVFGEGFLDLEAAYDGAGFRADTARIRLSSVVLPAGREKKGEREKRRQAEAAQIVSYFTDMHKAGHPLSDMVLLLGKMSHAQTYASALRDSGFECVVSGGSTFMDAPEVAVVNVLLQAVVNSGNTEALFQVLTSDMLMLSADDLIELTTYVDEDSDVPRRRDLDQGLDAMRRMGCSDDIGAALRHAVELFSRTQIQIRFERASKVVMDAISASGWIARLEKQGAEGTAVIGNILKAVRIIEQIEDEKHFGPARVAAEFDTMCTMGTKDKPGVLNVGGQQAIRIMTIHSSKGLEFPLVAVAEFSGSESLKSNLLMQPIGGRTYVSLAPGGKTLGDAGELGKAFRKFPTGLIEGTEFDVTERLVADRVASRLEFQPDAAAFRGMLCNIIDAEEKAERQRLFYVAATRAKESLAVVMGLKESKSEPQKAYKGLIDDLREALFGPECFPEESTTLDYGGSQGALFSLVRVSLTDGMSDGASVQDDSTDDDLPGRRGVGLGIEEALGTIRTYEPIDWMEAPAITPYRMLDTIPFKRDTGIFSYSSIADTHMTWSDAVEGMAQKDEFGRDPGLLLADADKATDFGSAFHRLAQLAAQHTPEFARSRFSAIAATYGVKDTERLHGAFERWVSSKACARGFAMRRHEPEVPFFVAAGDGVLEGAIDLFCTDDDARAYIVDYKTGGADTETPEELHDKHLLQAQCYAYATLTQGYRVVDLAFVRIERDDPMGIDTVQMVTFSFDEADKVVLADVITAQAALRMKQEG